MQGVTVVTSDSNVTTDNVTIRDLTIDCNWAELSSSASIGLGGEQSFTDTAVALFGSNNLLERVRCINSYGSGANKKEHFAMILAGSRFGDANNNVIRECRAEQPQGTYGNPFALAGWVWGPTNYMAANCKVLSCTAVGVNNGMEVGFTSGGVNMANVKDCEIDSNTFIDCFGAAYSDTGSIDGLRVTNNTVIRGWQGVGLANTPGFVKQNILISGNNFNIQNRLSDDRSYGITIAGGTSTNLTIGNNTISFDPGGAGVLSFCGIRALALNATVISDNTIGIVPATLVNYVSSTGVTLSNNLMSDGSPVAWTFF
jgi:hypothetical protein